MNILALQVKANTAETIGRKLEKTHEMLDQDIWKFKGALDYLSKVEKELNQITRKVKADVLGEDPSVKLDAPLDVAQYIIDKVMECSKKVHEQMERAAAAIPVAEGKKAGIEIALKDIHGTYKTSRERVAQIEKDLATGKFIVDSKGNVFSVESEDKDKEEEEPLTCHPSMFENKEEDKKETMEVEGVKEKVEEEKKKEVKKAEKKPKKANKKPKKLSQKSIKVLGKENAANS